MLKLKGSVTFGAGQPFVPGRLPPGPGSLMLRRRNDILSFQIRFAMVSKRLLSKIIIEVGSATLVLTDARVLAVTADDPPSSETLTLNFEKVEKTYVQYQGDGSKEDSPVEPHWDAGDGNKS